MSAAATLVTDGTPEAAALASWLRRKVDGISQVDALGPSDVATVARARRGEGGRQRLVVLAECPVPEADLDGSQALAVVRGWLSDLPPFEVRVQGVERIDAAAAAQRPGAADVLLLLRRISPTKAAAPAPAKRGRGRPKGERNPFRGAGFDVCVALLREPERAFTERALAEASEHSQFGVHRVVQELQERGFLRREAKGTRVAHPEALRDALAAAWAARLGVPRRARHFAGPPGRDPHEAALEALHAAGFEPVLAGPSALPRGLGLAGAPLTFYVTDDAPEALARAGFRVQRTPTGAIRLWPILEKALVAKAITRNGRAATHPVVTYLDLTASADERERRLALELVGEGS